MAGFESRRGHGCLFCVMCSKDRGRNQDNRDGGTTTEKVKRHNKRRNSENAKKKLGAGIFRTCPDRLWDAPSLIYNGYRVSFPSVKRRGRGVNPSQPSAEDKERVELVPRLPVLALVAYSRATIAGKS